MKKKLLAALLVLTLAAAVFLVPTIWGKPWSIEHFYGRVFAGFALRHPMMLSSMRLLEPMGIEWHNNDLDDASLDFARRENAWTEEQLTVLRRYDRAALEDPLSYDILDFFLDDAARGNRFMLHPYPITQRNGVHVDLPDFFVTTHQIHDLGDAEDYVERLSKVGAYVDQVIVGIDTRREEGLVAPRWVLEKALQSMREFLAVPARENVLATHFESTLGEIEEIPAEDRDGLYQSTVDQIESTVYPAWARLIEATERMLAVAGTDDGVWHLPDGEAYYAYRLRSSTTTDMSPAEVHELGLAEVERIEAEMRAIFETEGYSPEQIADAGLAATLESLLDDPRFLHEDSDAGRELILEEFRAIITEVEAGIDPLFDLRPKAPVAVERVPEFRQGGSAGAYYNAPPFDGSKPGIFYANLRNVKEHPRFGMRTLAYHEAVPGHHFQIALAQEMEGVPFFRRVIPFTAYTEGWALYAETLAAENGFQDDPYDRLGYLQSQLFRAVRLVVDTGIHQLRWSREESIDYMSSHTGMERSDVVSEIERYIVNPGQACAYKVGQLKILALRAKAQEALGERFNLRGFHNVVLGNGAVPLVLLERLVDQWIAAGEGN